MKHARWPDGKPFPEGHTTEREIAFRLAQPGVRLVEAIVQGRVEPPGLPIETVPEE
jgi:hypothetical protein